MLGVGVVVHIAPPSRQFLEKPESFVQRKCGCGLQQASHLASDASERSNWT